MATGDDVKAVKDRKEMPWWGKVVGGFFIVLGLLAALVVCVALFLFVTLFVLSKSEPAPFLDFEKAGVPKLETPRR